MLEIMRLVQANSKVALMNCQIIDVGEHVFVQLLHNTDDDSLSLLAIKNFFTYEITDFPLVDVSLPDLRLLFERYGVSTSQSL
jgi:hypothetical protein